MTTPESLTRLNDLLVEIHRSLIQYSGEAGLWHANHAGDLLGAVQSVMDRQQQDVGQLVKFLMQRHYRIDFGGYPHEYTSLHYVAIEYLATQIVENQQQLVDYLQASIPDFAGDAEAEQLVRQIAQSEQEGLERLRSVVNTSTPPQTVWMK